MAIPEKVKSNPFTKYIAEVRSELGKVTWPSRQTLFNHTLLVIGVSLVVAALIAGMDYILNLGVEFLLN